MDVLAYLDRRLKKKSYSLDDKCRYLYFQSCLLFSYDPRKKWLDSVKNDKLIQEIWNRNIDLRNVTDFNVICTSWTNEVYIPLLKELLGINADINGKMHQYVSFKNQKNQTILADATLGSDLARMKMGLSTKGYKKVGIKSTESRSWLRPQDQRIEYIKEFYWEETFEKIKQELNAERLSSSFLNYSDAKYCFYYLCEKFLEEPLCAFSETELFQDNSNSPWEFVSIYSICLPNDVIDIKLFWNQGIYDIAEIKQEEVKYLKRNLKGIGNRNDE